MSGTLSASARLLGNKELILSRWIAAVRAMIPSASAESEPVLINTFPAYITHLGEALAPQHPRTSATEGTTLAEEHGGERSRVTKFHLGDVIREFQLLRDVVVRFLEETGPVSEQERRTVLSSTDKSIAESAMAFVLHEKTSRELFTVALTHDLRQPLSAAKTGVELIARAPQSPEVPRWALRVRDSVDRMERMIRDLLDATAVRSGSRLKLPDIAECDMVAIARACVEEVQLTHGDCCVVVATEPIVGHWSAAALTRAFENLLGNALKYRTGEKPVTARLSQSHGRAVAHVHNHGSYIPASEQGNLFQAFTRSAEAVSGTAKGWGIGLAIVRAIAEAHGGSVGIDSLPETGTAFIFDIPLDARPFQRD